MLLFQTFLEDRAYTLKKLLYFVLKLLLLIIMSYAPDATSK